MAHDRDAPMTCLTTGIGSVPFDDVEAALAYVARHDIPWLPELIHGGRTETMEHSLRNPGRLACLSRFKRMIKGEGIETVKVQSPGLITAGHYIRDRAEAVERIWAHSEALLSDLGAGTVYVSYDEPQLVVDEGYRDWLAVMAAALRETFPDLTIRFMVHTCGTGDRGKLFDLSGLDVVAIDATLGETAKRSDIVSQARSEASSPDSESADWRNGKRVAWGINTVADLPLDHVRAGDLITATCGLRDLGKRPDPEAACYRVLDELNRAAAVARASRASAARSNAT